MNDGTANDSSPPAASRAELVWLRECLLRPLPEIPPRYFYDDVGSELFEQITQLPAYYQTRTEIELLHHQAAAIIAAAQPRHLVELGSGAGRKIRLILDAWRTWLGKDPRGTCTLLDVNQLFLQQSAASLATAYPDFTFSVIVGDFTADLGRLGQGGERLIILFGGTIGNLYPGERRTFLRTLAEGMEASDSLLIGVDLVKDPRRIEAAYNDSAGLTAAFNRNILQVLNRRFGADFEPASFAHRAFFDPVKAWIEMRLQALRPVTVHIPAIDLELRLGQGDELRTEISAKYTRESLAGAAHESGLALAGWFTDAQQLFGLSLLKKAPA